MGFHGIINERRLKSAWADLMAGKPKCTKKPKKRAPKKFGVTKRCR